MQNASGYYNHLLHNVAKLPIRATPTYLTNKTFKIAIYNENKSIEKYFLLKQVHEEEEGKKM